MISPRFATMFCFVQTDAALAADTLDLLTGVCVKRSFDRISVDGQLSTSDTVFVLANGASGVRVEPESRDELALGEALDALLRQLAVDIAADGEGAERVGRVIVRGRAEAGGAGGAGRGRLAAGQDGAARGRPQLRPHPAGGGRGVRPHDPFVVDLEIEGRQVVSAGEAIDLDDPDELAALEAVDARARGRVRADPARRGRRDRGVLQRPLGGIRDSSTRSTRHERRRNPSRGAALHPGLPRPDAW